MSRAEGNLAEDQAAVFLTDQGFKISDRNYFARVGEIDIIAKESGDICFIEVKERKYGAFGGAISSITKSKLDKILRTAKIYLHENKLSEASWRIDAVIIEGNNPPELIRNIYTEGM